MSMEYIRTTYGVPAKLGGRVEYTHPSPAKMGTITGTRGARLRIRLDGDDHSGNYHPTWELNYLPPSTMQELRDETPEPAHGCGHMQGRGAA